MQTSCWESSPKLLRVDKFKNLTTEAFYNNQSIIILLTKNGLMWHFKEPENTHNLIKFSQILSIKRSKHHPNICINYANHLPENILKLKKFKVKLLSLTEREKWSKIMTKRMKMSRNRMKSLFIFIDKIENRCKFKGEKVFEDNVKKVLEDAKITYARKDIETPQCIDNVTQYIETIKKSDGIIIISGDETVGQIITAIVNSYQTDDETIKSVPIPFGILPIGYHNNISYSIWRSNCIENALLNIILCKPFQADILCVSQNPNEKIWGFNFHYGFYSFLENYRRELNQIDGIVKETTVMKKAVQKFGEVECEVKFNLSKESKGQPTDDSSCHMNCLECNMQKLNITKIPIYKFSSSINSESTNYKYENEKSHRLYGTYKWIIVNSIPCYNDSMVKPFVPACHFNDNSADMVLVQPKNKKEFKKFLSHFQSDINHIALPFVRSMRIEEVHLSMNSQIGWTDSTDGRFIIPEVQKDFDRTIIVNDNISSNSENEEKEDRNHRNSITDPRKDKVISQMVKIFKGKTENDDNYKRPNMFESDREKIRKEEKKKKKREQMEKQKSVWMLDYNYLHNFHPSINIKVHSGLVTFFGIVFSCCDLN